MRYAIISDIHSNIQALEQAFKDIESDNIDEIICLGDVVGYNAKPVECVKAIQNNPKVKIVMQGNHDIDSCDDKHRWSNVSRDAYTGLKYSNSLLKEDDKEWLKSLNIDSLIPDKEMPFWVSHYSPEICTMHGYILGYYEARISLKVLKDMGGSNVFFFGHTHVPTYVEENEHGKMTFEKGKHLVDYPCDIKPDCYYLINPGAIGQPRSGITSYAIFDTKKKKVWIKNLEYDFKAAKKDGEEANYSLSIPNRLDPYKAGKQANKERCKKAQQKHKSK